MTHISSLLKSTKGFILFVSTTLLSVSFLWSAPIDRNRAQQLAEKLFATVELRNAKQTSTSGDLRLTLAIPRDADLLHGSANLLRNAENKDPLIYVFERGNGEGFALIAGDDRLDTCIGYSLTGSFSLQNAPHSLRSFLATYLNYMENRLRSAETHHSLGPRRAIQPPVSLSYQEAGIRRKGARLGRLCSNRYGTNNEALRMAYPRQGRLWIYRLQIWHKSLRKLCKTKI